MLADGKKFEQIKRAFLDALFPIHCFGCESEGVRLCADCLSSIRVMPLMLCPGCGRAAPGGRTHAACRAKTPLAALVSPYHYADPRLRGLIKEYKYHGARDIERLLSGLTAAGVRALLPFLPRAAQIVPMPLYPARERARGFNQASVLGAVVAQTLGGKMEKPLSRIRRTDEQARLSVLERMENCHRAFSSAPVSGICLLIDDVVTSGATMRAAAEELKKAGAHEVVGFALAHGRGDAFRS